MLVQQHDLWGLIWNQRWLDATDLSVAVAEQAAEPDLDYRTRLLIRDSVEALQHYWGAVKLERWLASLPVGTTIRAICQEPFEEVGFPSLRRRLMDKLDPEKVRQMFRELSDPIRGSLRLLIGGSIALIVPGYLTRTTEDIDVVDEVPAELRSQHRLLDELKDRYGLTLGHFQSHYLPSGFINRIHFFESFGSMHVYFVDVYDIFLGKLTSIRAKDLDDLRMLTPTLDKVVLVDRLKTTMTSTFAAQSLRERAEKNWHIIFGEQLPYDPDTQTSA